MLRVESYYRIIPYEKSSMVSGDQVFLKETDSHLFFAVIDGLGHGEKAYDAAIIATDYLDKAQLTDLTGVLKSLHNVLLKSRGIVIDICILNKETGLLTYSGVGNITTRIISDKNSTLISKDGVLGCRLPTIKIWEHKIKEGDLIISYSDGVKESFDFSEIANLKFDPIKDVAENILNKYAKDSDDVSILGIKILK
ncbi:MAG: SpoIIE family protein phosphatase [Spirochaetaceae bacterium]